MKKIIAVLMAVVMVFSIDPSVYAAEIEENPAAEEAVGVSLTAEVTGDGETGEAQEAVVQEDSVPQGYASETNEEISSEEDVSASEEISTEENAGNVPEAEETAGTLLQTAGELSEPPVMPDEGTPAEEGIAAGPSGSCGESVTWSLENGNTLRISGTGAMKNYSQSEMKSWQDEIEDWDTVITSVVIEDGVTTIGNYAFDHHFAVSSVSMPDSVTDIGEGAFRECGSLSDITFSSELETIGKFSFYGCNGLSEIVIPDGVETIGEGAFAESENLKSVTLPDSVTSIGESAFYYCENLTEITLPGGLKEICSRTFYGCWALPEIVIPDGVETIGSDVFSDCSALKSVTLPDSVTSLGSYAFAFCEKLKSVKLPAGITEIPENCFKSCFMLEEVNIPDGVTKIGSRAFYSNDALKTIALPDGITEIGSEVFAYSDVLENVVLSASLQTVSYGTFTECTGLKSVVIPEGVTTIGASAFNTCTALKEVAFPDSLTSIGKEAFLGCTALETVRFPEASDGFEIGEGAFNSDQKIVQLTIPGSVTTIGKSAFSSCTSLKSVTIEEGVSEIGQYAFRNCTQLERIEIPASVEKLGNDLFIDCIQGEYDERVFDIVYGGTKAQWAALTPPTSFRLAPEDEPESRMAVIKCTDGSVGEQICGDDLRWTIVSGHTLEIRGSGAMYDWNNYEELPWYDDHVRIASVVISEGVTTIGAHAFEECETLTGVSLPDSLTEIGDAAFADCYMLKILTVPAGVQSIHDSAFSDCNRLKTIRYLGLRDDWEDTIGFDCLLHECVVTGTDGKTGYYYCGDDLKWSIDNEGIALKIDGTGAMDSWLLRDRPWEEYIDTIQTVEFGPDVTSIGCRAFANARNLKEIKAEGQISEIGAKACADCWNLEKITFDDNLKQIGRNAMDGCKSLKEVTIPAGTTAVGGGAFAACTELKAVNYPGTDTKWKTYKLTSDDISGASVKYTGNYTVKFHANGGKGTMAAYTYTGSGKLPANSFTRTGYTYTGWNSAANGKGRSLKNTAAVTGVSETAYAQWKANSYKVVFKANGGKGSMTNEAFSYGTAKALTKNKFTRTGYTFTGWNTQANGKGTAYKNAASVKNLTSKNGGTITLYAQWKANSYKVAFKANGGKGSMSKESFTYGKAKQLTKNKFKRSGYKFVGWTTKKNGKGKVYKNAAKVKNLTSKKGGTVTLYAKWKKK